MLPSARGQTAPRRRMGYSPSESLVSWVALLKPDAAQQGAP